MKNNGNKKKTWKQILIAVLAVLLALIMVLGVVAPYLYADDEADLKRLKNEQSDLEDAAEAKEAAMAKYSAQMKNAQKQIAEYDDQLLAAEQKIQALTEELAQTEDELAQAEEALKAAEKKEDDYSALLAKRIQSMYESRNVSYIEILLGSESLADFFCRLEYVRQVVEYDNEIKAQLTAATNEVSTQKSVIEEKKATLENDKAEEEKTVTELEATKEKKLALLATISAEYEAAQDELMEIELESKELQDRIWKVEKEIAARKAREEAERKAREEAEKKRMAEEAARKKQEEALKAVERLNSLDFRWPIVNRTGLSDRFGERIHPITHIKTMHYGIDIPAPSGTDIHAIESGVVVTAIGGAYTTGYGRYVIISHGDGVLSLYCHCSSVDVKVGDYVQRGDVIAHVGTTGNSTGNHLHLGISVNGTWVDPLIYVPKNWQY